MQLLSIWITLVPNSIIRNEKTSARDSYRYNLSLYIQQSLRIMAHMDLASFVRYLDITYDTFD